MLTPTGFKNIEDMRVGDAVITPNNTVELVQAVYPQGEVDLYRIHFQDGRTIDCCGEHLWKCYMAGRIDRPKITNTLSLAKFTKKYENTKGIRKYLPIIPLTKSTGSFSNSEVYAIKPYTLGAILGDGHINKKGNVILTNMDDFIFNEITKDGYILGKPVHKKDNQAYACSIIGVGSEVRKLKLEGKKSQTKFIPELYKQGTIEDKFSLLQGLFDTDGYVCDTGNVYFDITSHQMAKDVIEILHSLGFSAKLSTKQGKYKKDGVEVICSTVYKVYVRGENCEKLFRLPRKKSRCRVKKVGLRVEKVEPIGRGKATCISITGDDKLFITTNYIVTHNSHLAQMFSLKYKDDPHFRAVYIRESSVQHSQSGGYDIGYLAQ